MKKQTIYAVISTTRAKTRADAREGLQIEIVSLFDKKEGEYYVYRSIYKAFVTLNHARECITDIYRKYDAMDDVSITDYVGSALAVMSRRSGATRAFYIREIEVEF